MRWTRWSVNPATRVILLPTVGPVAARCVPRGPTLQQVQKTVCLVSLARSMTKRASPAARIARLARSPIAKDNRDAALVSEAFTKPSLVRLRVTPVFRENLPLSQAESSAILASRAALLPPMAVWVVNFVPKADMWIKTSNSTCQNAFCVPVALSTLRLASKNASPVPRAPTGNEKEPLHAQPATCELTVWRVDRVSVNSVLQAASVMS